MYFSENNRYMSNNNNFRMLLSAAIIIAFFLPWFSVYGSTASGLDMVLQRVSNEGQEKTATMIIQYSFLLIPFFALIVLIRTAGKKSSGFFLRLLPFLVTAILSALFIVGVMNEGGKESLNSWFQMLSYGFYITVIASLLLIFV